MVAVKYSYPVAIFLQEGGNFIADSKESIKGRSFMVFPFVATDILELFILDASSTDVDGDVFVLVSILEKLPNGVD
jgi:hypothetical protein